MKEKFKLPKQVIVSCDVTWELRDDWIVDALLQTEVTAIKGEEFSDEFKCILDIEYDGNELVSYYDPVNFIVAVEQAMRQGAVLFIDKHMRVSRTIQKDTIGIVRKREENTTESDLDYLEGNIRFLAGLCNGETIIGQYSLMELNEEDVPWPVNPMAGDYIQRHWNTLEGFYYEVEAEVGVCGEWKNSWGCSLPLISGD